MKKSASVICCMVFLAACGGEGIVETRPLDDLYSEAYEKLEGKNFEEAAGLFTEAESSWPTSPWAADALIMAAYSQYQDRNFAEAITTIDRFMRFYPGHKDVAYVLYLRGMCFWRQVSDVRREPGMGNMALSAFSQLIQRFPDSEYAENAKNKIAILRNYIAGKIMYSARRDMRRQNWTVAITNLQTIVTQMQDTQMAPEALFRLYESYTAIGIPAQAEGFAEMLRLNFPDSEWAKKVTRDKK